MKGREDGATVLWSTGLSPPGAPVAVVVGGRGASGSSRRGRRCARGRTRCATGMRAWQRAGRLVGGEEGESPSFLSLSAAEEESEAIVDRVVTSRGIDRVGDVTRSIDSCFLFVS